MGVRSHALLHLPFNIIGKSQIEGTIVLAVLLVGYDIKNEDENVHRYESKGDFMH